MIQAVSRRPLTAGKDSVSGHSVLDV